MCSSDLTLAFNPITGQLRAPIFLGSGSGLNTNTIPSTSMAVNRFKATTTSQNISAGQNSSVIFNAPTENTGYTYNGATGVITFNTSASYSITLTGTWSGAPYDSSAPVPTMGGLRIITNTGMTYMGSTQNDGTNWISTITIVMRISATTDTIVCKAYNPSSSLLTITPNIEILRIGG